MIDTFSLALTHALMLIAAWRLFRRPDLDEDGAARTESRFVRRERPPRA